MEGLDISKEFEKKEVQPEKPKKEDPSLEKRSQKFLFVVLGLILVVGIIVFSNSSPEILTLDDKFEATMKGKLDESEGYLYNGFAFVNVEGLWVTRLLMGETQIQSTLHFGPKDVEDVPVEGSLNQSFFQREIFLTIDPNSSQQSYLGVAGVELGGNLFRASNAIILASCTQNHTACDDRPIVTCNSTEKPVIELRIANETKIILDGNCAILQGYEFGVVKAVDKFLLKWYRIEE